MSIVSDRRNLEGLDGPNYDSKKIDDKIKTEKDL